MAATPNVEDTQVTRERHNQILSAIEARQKSNQRINERIDFDAEKDLRQQFRALINPGITRRAGRHEIAILSMQTLLTIAENLLKDPENPKFQRFKPTNTIIKERLVDVPGALEYAIAMGFRAEVENFQPYYVHAKTRQKELRVGASMLREAIALEHEKSSRQELIAANERQVKESAIDKVKVNFEEDRKERQLRDQMERERRESVARAQLLAKERDKDQQGGKEVPPVGILKVVCHPDDETRLDEDDGESSEGSEEG